MSTIASLLTSCPDTQVGLYTAFDKYAGTYEPLPQLEWLNSEINNSAIKGLITRPQGKLINVDVTYFRRRTESQLLTNQSNPVCSGGELDPDTTTTYQLDSSVNIQDIELTTIDDLERHCQSNPQYFADLIARLADNVERGVATKSATESAALIGKWASNVTVDGSDNLVVATKYADGTQDPSFIGDIRLATMKTGYVGGAINFADSLLYRAYMDALVGCCSDSGINVAETLAAYGVATMYDYRVEAAMAAAKVANTSMLTQNGAMTLLYHTRSGWTDGMPMDWKIGGNYAFRTIIGRTGTPMDLTISDNCGAVTIAVTATTKVVGLPQDMYKSGDRLEGVTGVNSVLVTNP